MPKVFDYEKKYIYKDEFNRDVIEYYPMKYKNNVNAAKPTINETWVNYGTGASSTADSNNCPVEMTSGEILNSGSFMNGQVSCEPNSYNAGNYYNFPAASAKSNEPTPNSVCSKGWRLPEKNGDANYSNLLLSYSVDFNAGDNRIEPYDAALLNLPLSFLRSGGYNGTGALNGQGYSGYYRMSSLRLLFYSSYLNPTNYADAYNGYSVRCVSR